ncbi:hypothetical protein D3C86_1434850 [compost metagenome]
MQGNHQVVRTRLGHGVDHAAGGAAELSRIAARLDFNRTVEIERHGRASEEVGEVRDVQAVYIICVFGDGRAADRRKIAKRIIALRGARRQQGDSRDAPIDRNRLDQFLQVNRHTGGGAVEVQRLTSTGDDDVRNSNRITAGRSHFEGEAGLSAQADRRRLRNRVIAIGLDGDRVGADRNQSGAEGAAGVGRGVTNEALRVRTDLDRCTRDRSAARCDGAAERARGDVLRNRHGGRCKHGGRNSRKRHKRGAADHRRLQQALADSPNVQNQSSLSRQSLPPVSPDER